MANWHRKYPEKFVDCVCEHCGKTFQRTTSEVVRGKAGRFCSKSCVNLARSYRSTPAEERFWSKVDKNGAEARSELGPCWLWTAFVKDNGYGQFGRGANDGVYAHRYSFELANGTIPDGMCVLHRCDVRNCVRPDHLFLGTELDNAQDRDAKGRLVTPFVHGHGYSAWRRKAG
jgi:hypothetical protein